MGVSREVGVRRLGLTLAAVAAGLGVAAAGQSVADGSVSGNVYTNRYFHVSLALPPNFRAMNLSALHAPGAMARDEFVMLAAREGEGPSGMIVIAEKVGVGPSHIADEQNFLERMRKTWSDGEVLDGQQLRTQKDGLTFHEVDYEIPKDEFDSAMVTRVGDYLLIFKCNAKSRAQLKVMQDAVVALHHE
jgi:hypothetical protein